MYKQKSVFCFFNFLALGWVTKVNMALSYSLSLLNMYFAIGSFFTLTYIRILQWIVSIVWFTKKLKAVYNINKAMWMFILQSNIIK